ncbi:MAG: hypothetical protein KDB68_06660 [Planctomycetes bacterium]|nr:hypothetical protein [Planctomycetota bacterium]MCA8935870.1 hypothetical protein [Planctomycetota bacterium]MCA8946149.1 hypothetical protein [Planctomycetota bacterium]
MSDRLPIPEIDDEELRQHILKLRGLVAEETIETLKMVRLDHIVNPRGKLNAEYDQQAFRAWVIAWLNSLETVLCAHMAMMTKRLWDEKLPLEPTLAHPKLLLDQVEDIRRALEIILHAEPEMTPQPITGEHPKPKSDDTEEENVVADSANDETS